MRDFDAEHEQFIQGHLEARSGERRGRLQRGHQHGEILFLRNVWWPVVGNWEDLHPEYEVRDWRNQSYFADFMWLPEIANLIIEIKGYNVHVRDLDRQGYCNETSRETFFHAIGYNVISIAYDQVANQPDVSRMLLRMVLTRYMKVGDAGREDRQSKSRSKFGGSRTVTVDREIIKLAVRLARPARTVDVMRLWRGIQDGVRHAPALL